MNPGLVTVIAVVLGGGFLTGLGALLNSLATARKMKADEEAAGLKLPVERDSLIVSGAERAVLTMQHALEAAERRIAELERRETEAEERQEQSARTIASLRRELEDLREQLNDYRRSLEQAEAKVTVLTERLAAIDST